MAGEVQKLVVGIHYVVNKASQAAALRFHDGVERSFKGIEQSIKWINANADAMWKGLGKGAGALSATFAAIAGGTAVISHDIVRQQDYARSLATTVDEWSRWEHAGMRARVESQDFRAALISLTGAIEQAGAGSEDTQKLFKRLGVSWKGVDGNLRTSLDLLPELADGLNRMSDGDKAAAMVRIFGEDDGAKLFSLISLGSAGMQDLRMEADRLGVTIDQGTADAAIRLQSTMAKLYGTLKGLGLQLFREVAPTFERLAESLARLFDDSEGWMRLGLDAAIHKLGVALRGLESPAGMAAAALLSVGAVMVGAQATLSVPILGSVSGALVSLATGLKTVTVAAATAAAGLLGIPLGLFAGLVAAAAATVGLLYLVWDEFATTAEGGDSIIRRVADSLGIGAEVAQLFAGSMAILTGGLSLTVAVLSQLVTGIGTLGGAIVSMVGMVQAPLQWVIDAFFYILGAMPRGIGQLLQGLASFAPVDAQGNQTTAFGSLLEGAGGGIEGVGRLVQEGPQAMLRATLGGIGGAGQSLGGVLQNAADNENRKAAGLGPATGATVSQSITVQVAGTSATAEEIAAASARANRRALEAMDEL